MLRIVFRSVLVLTLTLLAILKASRTRIPSTYAHVITYWMLCTGVLAMVFLVFAAVQAVKDPVNRRLHLRDAMVAVIWIIFWLLSLGG